MKKEYNKPELRSVKLIAAETLLSLSGNTPKLGIDDSDENAITGGANGGILSNKESEHNIWGNDGSSMWN